MTIRKKDGRLTVAPLGEFYEDLLRVDSWINARTIASQANSLLCAKLMQRQAEIRDRIQYLATKRGISAEDLWSQILSGEAERESLTSENEIEN
ncbi:MAG: hypothetical protein WCD53_30890 [Microcoleus sp.]